MERCNAITISVGTQCTFATIANSKYCEVHDKILKRKSLEDYELLVLENQHERQIKEFEYQNEKTLKHETSDTKRKQLQKEIEKTIETMKKEHTWETFKHWLARDERARRAKGGAFTNI